MTEEERHHARSCESCTWLSFLFSEPSDRSPPYVRGDVMGLDGPPLIK